MNQPTAQAAPDFPGQIRAGYDLLRRGRIGDAVAHARTLAETYPEQAQVFAFSAEANRLADDLTGALAAIDTAIALSDDAQHKIKKAWLLSRAYRRDEVAALAETLSAQAGSDATLLWQIGKLYYHHNLLAPAIAHYERALALVGDRAAWRYDLAVARFYAGQAAEAETDLNRVLETSPQAGAVIYLRATLGRQTPDRNHVSDIESRLAAGFDREEDRACALYALGKELEDLGAHDRSFAAIVAGAKARRGTLRYDPAGFYATLDEIQAVMDSSAMSAPVAGSEGEGAIFILGMPRTGTTLAERMLLQSGEVKNAGELTDFGFLMSSGIRKLQAADPGITLAEASLQLDFAALGAQYMQGARQMAGGSSRFIDKMPANFMYSGVIRKSLPNAKIIHLVRDPLDSCYAIFKTLFFNAYEFSYDQVELADYFIAYRRLMAHWHAVMPGAILDVRYEDLVTDPEAQSRRIYDWCGLAWTPAALSVPDKGAVFATASAAQVREPVHARSVRNSRRHVVGLAPLVDRLTAADLYEP